MDEIGGGLDEAGGVVGFGFLEGEGGGDAGVGERYQICCEGGVKVKKKNNNGVCF